MDIPMKKETVAAMALAILCCGTAMAQMRSTPSQQPTGNNQQQGAMAQPGAQPQGTMAGGSMMAGAGQDKMFAKKALQGGMAEVDLGKLALQKSSNDDVKMFAQKMVDDHTAMGNELQPIAQNLNVTIPTTPSPKDQKVMARLQGLSGAQFDKAYMADMVKDHKMDLADFTMESNNGQDPQLKAEATKGAGIIQQHLQMAEDINKKLMKGGTMGQ